MHFVEEKSCLTELESVGTRFHQTMVPSDPPVYRVGGRSSTAVAVTLCAGGESDHIQAIDRHFIE